jgi:hypothetical protein
MSKEWLGLTYLEKRRLIKMAKKSYRDEYFMRCKSDSSKFQITLMNPGKLEKYDVSSVMMAPEESGVYFLYSGSKIIYVGRAKSIKNRIQDHIRTLNFPKVEKFSFILISGIYDRMFIEKLYIYLLTPIHNIQYNPERMRNLITRHQGLGDVHEFRSLLSLVRNIGKEDKYQQYAEYFFGNEDRSAWKRFLENDPELFEVFYSGNFNELKKYINKSLNENDNAPKP